MRVRRLRPVPLSRDAYPGPQCAVRSGRGTAWGRLARGRRCAVVFAAVFAWLVCVGLWQVGKPMPEGTYVRTPAVTVAARDVRFLHDLTYQAPDGGIVHQQQIFDEVLEIIDAAETFIVADFFLINDRMGAAGGAHRHLSVELASHLMTRKAARPELSILLLTDPINDVYGGAPLPLFDDLREAGIQVVTTALQPLRDPNPAWSAPWRVFAQWWGNSSEGGRLPNPFASGDAGISLRSWLTLVNFKANHRKLIVADRADGDLTVLVTSANPHDASSAHSNVALRFSDAPGDTGGLAQRILDSELAVARFSGWAGSIGPGKTRAADTASDPVQLSFLTEQAIRDHLLQALDAARARDRARIAVFYLSDRRVIEGLLAAAARGVEVRVILDPNRDAFGLEKDGVPNRPVANELVTRSGGRIAVRWYRTHGEQFHSKIMLVTRGDRLIASLGSANFTRRNLGNYNLEANIAMESDVRSAPARAMVAWFDRLWENDDPAGAVFTADFDAWRDTSRARYWRYRIMEATGLSTF